MEVLFLGSLCTVLGTALVTSCNALSIKCSADDVVTASGKVTYTAAANKNDGVLLKVMTDSGDVGGCLKAVGKSYSGDLTKRGVRLLRAYSGNLCANASLLGRRQVGRYVLKGVEALLKNGRLRLVLALCTAVFYQLVKGRHTFPPFL